MTVTVDARVLAEDFARWRERTGHLDVGSLDGLIAVERAQAAQAAVLASGAARARIAGAGS